MVQKSKAVKGVDFRAVCSERCMHGSVGGGWKRADVRGNALAAYPTVKSEHSARRVSSTPIECLKNRSRSRWLCAIVVHSSRKPAPFSTFSAPVHQTRGEIGSTQTFSSPSCPSTLSSLFGTSARKGPVSFPVHVSPMRAGNRVCRQTFRPGI
jgi:hypothetical protein